MWLLRPSNVLPDKNRGACPCSWASRGAEEHVPSLVLLITYLADIGGWSHLWKCCGTCILQRCFLKNLNISFGSCQRA